MTNALQVAGAVMQGAFGANSGRTAIATLAIALGVALGFAIRTVNQSAVDEFTAGVATLSGNADLVVRGPGDGFDESVYPTIARLGAVAVASPVVEVDARLPGRDESLRLSGIDVFRAAAVTPALVGRGGTALDLLRPDRVFLSPAALARLGLASGDELVVQAGTTVLTFVVGGSIEASAGQLAGAVDIAAAQDAFGRTGRLSRVDVRLRPGADVDAARAAIASVLPAGVSVARPSDAADMAARMTRAYRVNLDVLALVALFTGSLLVFSTQALSVVRRRTQFALLRTLGLPRRRLAGVLLAEGALVGAAGSVIGIAAGYALASMLLRAFGADLGAGFFRGEAPAPSFSLLSALAFVALGIAAAAAGAWLPAIEAARASPAAALKAGDDEAMFGRLASPVPGIACLGFALAIVWLPPVGGLPMFGYAAIALMLVGTLLLLPRITRAILSRVLHPRSTGAALALDSLRAAPGQATVSLAAIVAAVALAVSMAIMVASFRESLADWLDRVLPADVYVRSGGATGSAWLAPEDQRALASLPGVRHAEFLRATRLQASDGDPPVTLLARDIDRAQAAQRLPVVGETTDAFREGTAPAWVSEAYADRYRVAPGTTIRLPIAGRNAEFTVAGVWRDYARQTGAVIVERTVYARLAGDDRVNDAALWLAPDATPGRVRDAIDAHFGRDRVTIATPGEIRAISLAVFDRTFAVTYALEAVAIAIGLVGLSASFGALALARRREFGVLRHLGMTRRQIGAMLAAEGAIVSAVGLAVGLALGGAISVILVHVVNRQSFRWSMDLHLPAAQLAAFCVAMLTLATVTALASARRATAGDTVMAVKEDW
ncbi:MAG: FtsX-like permease family protein [Betaproteobacteria bacterium]|nr:FtsX-like permease family protein [Betaproteobacteria bacterium]